MRVNRWQRLLLGVRCKVHINIQSFLPMKSNNNTVIILRCLATWLTKRRWLNHQQKSNLIGNCMGKHVELPVMWNITGPSIQCCRCNWEINQALKFFHNLALEASAQSVCHTRGNRILPKSQSDLSNWRIPMWNCCCKFCDPRIANEPLYLKDLRTPWDASWHVLHVP